MTCCPIRQGRFFRLTDRFVAASAFLKSYSRSAAISLDLRDRSGADGRPDALLGPIVSSGVARPGKPSHTTRVEASVERCRKQSAPSVSSTELRATSA
jgi:hypothetical protein